MKPENELQSPIQVVSPAREPVRDQDKIMLVFAYLGILALIPLLTVKDSPFVKWHAKNGLVLGIATFIISTVLGWVPWLNCVMVPLLMVAYIVVVVLAIRKALQGERWRIPGVSDLAEKF